MVQEDAVHGIPDGVQAAEGEGEVAEAPTEGDAGALSLDLRHSVDEIKGIGVVLWKPCGDGQHVAVKDDVLGVEVQLGPQQPIAPGAYPHLVLERRGLALFVEGHDDHCRAEPLAEASLPQELLLAHLQGDGVHDALALHALQALLDDRPLGGVDHEGQPCHVRLRHAEAHELAHGGLSVDEVRVEVEVEDVGLLLALSEANFHSLVPFVGIHELLELGRTHQVAPLTYQLEAACWLQHRRLQAGQLHVWILGQLRQLSRRALLQLAGNRSNV
mmetsp:Transcript_128794/g.400735  ORF Transcript_128794/g.400735 Transcript_128794/m.400735 type:complete len:273 (+) Transcript_128794:2341-3159(+)